MKEGDFLKRCELCGCIIEDSSGNVCDVCKDDMAESNISGDGHIDTDVEYNNFVMKRFMGVK